MLRIDAASVRLSDFTLPAPDCKMRAAALHEFHSKSICLIVFWGDPGDEGTNVLAILTISPYQMTANSQILFFLYDPLAFGGNCLIAHTKHLLQAAHTYRVRFLIISPWSTPDTTPLRGVRLSL